MSKKIFKTLDEQISILKERKLRIDDETEAKEFLRLNNYYRVSGYSLTLRDHDVFYENANFSNIVDIYMFDHCLRHILLKYLEQIEVKIKSIYAYEFARLHGALGYMSSSNFVNLPEYLRIMGKVNEQAERNLKQEAYIQHYLIDLEEDMPIWVYVDLFTIADISKLYSISKKELKEQVATSFGFTKTNGANLLGEYLYSLTNVRNLCAHGSRLFNRLFIRKPTLNSKERKLLIVSEDGEIDNSHLYGFVIMMKRLLTNESFFELKSDLISLHNRYPFVGMKYYGFREDWKENL